MPGLDLPEDLGAQPEAQTSQLDNASYFRNVGAIDIGTNSTHLLIASVDPILKTFTIKLAEKSTTRLGEHEPGSENLSEESIGRVLETLKRFKQLSVIYAKIATFSTKLLRVD